MHLERKTVCKAMNFIVNECILFKLKCEASSLGDMLQCLYNKCYQWNYFPNNASHFPKMLSG